jgi:hypothetical protein
MPVDPRDLAAGALRQPDAMLHLHSADWDRLVRQARYAGLLARLGETLDEAGMLDRVPDAPRAHVRAAIAVAEAQHLQVRREVALIVQALRPIGVTPVLLKGAAYVHAGLPAARGRVFSDIDILVPKARLPEVEAALMAHGWATTHHAPYDQKYYREWMHELPPMRHIVRDTVLDVHHTILPATARLKPDAAKLFAAATDLPGDGVGVLAPADMVLHSMTHLFHNDELGQALRDLSDLDLLLRHFGSSPSFWPGLAQRAQELDLSRPLYYGLRHVQRVLATPVPQETLAATATHGPGWPLNRWMDALWSRALRPAHRTAADLLTAPSLFLLYLRAHWLRMPPLLLARHLAIKSWRRNFGDGTAN